MKTGITKRKANAFAALLCAMGIICSAFALTQVPVESLEENIAHAEGEAMTQASKVYKFHGVYSPDQAGQIVPGLAVPAAVEVALGTETRISEGQIPSAANGAASDSMLYNKYSSGPMLATFAGWTTSPVVVFPNGIVAKQGFDKNAGVFVSADLLPFMNVVSNSELVAKELGSADLYAVYAIDDAVTVGVGAMVDGDPLSSTARVASVFVMPRGASLSADHGAFTDARANTAIAAGYVNGGYMECGNGEPVTLTPFVTGAAIENSTVIMANYTASTSESVAMEEAAASEETGIVPDTTGLFGDNIADPAEAVVSSTFLKTNAVGFSELKAAIEARGYVALNYYDIIMTIAGAEVHDGFDGLTLKFPVNAGYDGKQVTVFHYLSAGNVQEDEMTASSGFVEIYNVNSLSPFAVAVPTAELIPGTAWVDPTPSTPGGGSGTAGDESTGGDSAGGDTPSAQEPTDEPAADEQGEPTEEPEVTEESNPVKAAAKVFGEQLPQTADAMNLPVLMLGFFLLAIGGFIIMATRVLGVFPEELQAA